MLSHHRVLIGILCANLCLLLAPGLIAAQETPTAATPADATPEARRANLAPGLPQPSYDVIRVEQEGGIYPYVVWADWVPDLIATPDGGGWAFFSAAVRQQAGIGSRRLFAARFDPANGVWQPAQPIPGGVIQFGPAVVVDSQGTVHLVFSDRATEEPESLSTLLYTQTNDQGTWETPVPVAPDPNAGHQMLSSLAIDSEDRLHLIWRDQRSVSAEARTALVANADLFASDFVDGIWSAPVQVNQRPSDDINASWPFIVVDGDRLIAVWSTYRGTAANEMTSAVRVEWSTRPLADDNGWTPAATLLERDGGETGGRSIDLVADPRGGVMLVFGRLNQQQNTLSYRRLEAGSNEWGDAVALGSGDFGYLPALTIGADGTGYLAFNSGRNRDVEVGALMIPLETTAPATPIELTPGEEGEHGRVAVALTASGRPWVVYMHAASGSANATEIRSLRDARFQH